MRLGNLVLSDGRRALCRLDDDVATPLVIDDADGLVVDPLRRLLNRGDVRTASPVGEPVTLSGCRLRAPVLAPGKIIGVGLNYAPHAEETALSLPETPIAFAKYATSIIGPGEPIRYEERDTFEVDYEAELAVVIGSAARNVTADDALEHVLGYTVCNDVSARDVQFKDGQWVRGKSFDTFCPLGPWILTSDEIHDVQSLDVRCRVNGRVLQEASTKEMIFGVAELIAFFSRTMTLVAGDVIATGTPAGVGFTRTPPLFLRDGDVVEVEVEHIGTLQNPVVVRADEK